MSTNTYLKTRDGILLFKDYRKMNFPVMHIKKINNDTFQVILFRSETDVINEYFNNPKELRKLYEAVYDEQLPEKFNKRSVIYDIADTISTTVMNKGSAVIKRSTPMFIYKTNKLNKEKLFDLLVDDYQMQPARFIKWFGKVNSEEVLNIKHKKWNAYHHKIIKEGTVTKILDKVESLLSRKGFGNLAYGDIQFLKENIGDKNYSGDYFETPDSIRIKITTPSKMLIDIIHELGHRKYSKKFNSNQRTKIFKIFKDLKLRKDDENLNDFKSFVSPSSMRNVDEFFAELFTNYTFNNINKNAKDWLENIL